MIKQVITTLCALLGGFVHISPKSYKVSKVKKGRHDFDISFRYTLHDSIRVHVCFPSKSYVETPGEDLWDYSKAPGLMYGLNNHRNTAMLGWRMVNSVIQTSYYVHPSDKSKLYLPAGKTVDFLPDTWWWYQISDRGDHWHYLWSNGVEHTIPKEKNVSPPYRINGWWFGGTSSAPADIEVLWWMERFSE